MMRRHWLLAGAALVAFGTPVGVTAWDVHHPATGKHWTAKPVPKQAPHPTPTRAVKPQPTAPPATGVVSRQAASPAARTGTPATADRHARPEASPIPGTRRLPIPSTNPAPQDSPTARVPVPTGIPIPTDLACPTPTATS